MGGRVKKWRSKSLPKPKILSLVSYALEVSVNSVTCVLIVTRHILKSVNWLITGLTSNIYNLVLHKVLLWHCQWGCWPYHSVHQWQLRMISSPDNVIRNIIRCYQKSGEVIFSNIVSICAIIVWFDLPWSKQLLMSTGFVHNKPFLEPWIQCVQCKQNTTNFPPSTVPCQGVFRVVHYDSFYRWNYFITLFCNKVNQALCFVCYFAVTLI